MPWCNSPQAWCHAGAGRSFRISLTGQVRGWVTHLCSQRSPATVRKIHRVLSLVLALAVRDGQLTRNLAPEVNLPRVGLTRARLPTAWFALAAPMVGGAVTPGLPIAPVTLLLQLAARLATRCPSRVHWPARFRRYRR